jgi:preprotein translocase subunit SecG
MNGFLVRTTLVVAVAVAGVIVILNYFSAYESCVRAADLPAPCRTK